MTFDENFAKVCGTKVRLYNLMEAVIIEMSAALGYDGVEVMVWSEKITQDVRVLGALSSDLGQPVLSIHAPTLLLTRGVFGTEPWDKVDRSIEMAQALGAPTVVFHPPFFWQKRYARTFVAGVGAEIGRASCRERV